jgi:hypothetical protein
MSEMERPLNDLEVVRGSIKNDLNPEVVRAKALLLDPWVIAESRFPDELGAIKRQLITLSESRSIISADLRTLITQEQETGVALRNNHQEREKITSDLELHQEKILTKIFKFLGIRDSVTQGHETNLRQLTQKDEEHMSALDVCRRDISECKSRLKDLPLERVIERSFEEEMLARPLSNDEKVTLLKPEVLSSLSVEEFFAVWRRLDPNFVSHVTRHGIRDHNSMWEHSGGLEEWHDSAKKIFESGGRLLTPFAARGLSGFTEAEIKSFLSQEILNLPNEEEAKRVFRSTVNTSLASAPNYPDKTAVHFAVQIVLNDYYGGESDNEVFFIIPADVLASQHIFHSSKYDLDRPDQNKKFNDLFVWPVDHQKPFISANNGICFMPRSTLVDPATGSKYATALEVIDGLTVRVPIKNKIVPGQFSAWIKEIGSNNDVMMKAELLKSEQEKLQQLWSERSASRSWDLSHEYQIRDQSRVVEATQQYLSSAIESELVRIGLPGDCLSALSTHIAKIAAESRDLGDFVEQLHDRFIEQATNKFKLELSRAESPITAEQFWKSYFETNPGYAPARVIFYDGDPTQAVRDCLLERDVYSQPFEPGRRLRDSLSSDAKNPFQEFSSNATDMPFSPTEHRVYAGHSELMRIGNTIIEAHFQ